MSGQAAFASTFIHTVFFWLKSDISKEEEKEFLTELKTLAEVEQVRNCFIGPPAGTPREVVDGSYQYSLVLHFDSPKAQDEYQVHPIHDAFVKKVSHLWTRVQVYDSITDMLK